MGWRTAASVLHQRYLRILLVIITPVGDSQDPYEQQLNKPVYVSPLPDHQPATTRKQRMPTEGSYLVDRVMCLESYIGPGFSLSKRRSSVNGVSVYLFFDKWGKTKWLVLRRRKLAVISKRLLKYLSLLISDFWLYFKTTMKFHGAALKAIRG